jgi:hypothetical protein
MNFIIISKNYIYVIILSNGRTQWAIIISSSIPTIHAVSFSLYNSHLRTCRDRANSSLALRSRSAIAKRISAFFLLFSKLMLGVLFL